MADELNLLSFVEFIDKGNDRKIRTFKERSDVINLYDDENFAEDFGCRKQRF